MLLGDGQDHQHLTLKFSLIGLYKTKNIYHILTCFPNLLGCLIHMYLKYKDSMRS